MRNVLIILFVSMPFSNIILGNNNQGHSSGFAKIRFIDYGEDHSKTYLGKLIKGDLGSLKYELQQNFANQPSSTGDQNKKNADKSVEQATSKSYRNNDKNAKKDLIGNYEVKDEKSLAKIKEKKTKEKEKRASDKGISGNNGKHTEEQKIHKPNSQLSKNYRITGRRILNGQTVRKPAGYVCLIVKYKVPEGNYVNTYVNIVEDYLKEGSKYNLKYHGNGSKRKYYLEYVSLP
jgi:hypothetical protein